MLLDVLHGLRNRPAHLARVARGGGRRGDADGGVEGALGDFVGADALRVVGLAAPSEGGGRGLLRGDGVGDDGGGGAAGNGKEDSGRGGETDGNHI